MDWTGGFSGWEVYIARTFLWPVLGFAPAQGFIDAVAEWCRVLGPGMMRWHVYYRFFFLRCVSFGMDRYWARREAITNTNTTNTNTNTTRRRAADSTEYSRLTVTSRPLASYSLAGMVSYLCYLPLLLAGPIVSFNAYDAQGDPRVGLATVATPRKTILWGLARVALYVLCINLFLHFNYSVMLVSSGDLHGLSSWELWVLQYSQLNFMFFKYLTIWRFFQLWAALDGVYAPKNMLRCMSNNWTFAGFWRQWHASFNLFNITYLYLPLGGRKRQTLLLWVIFLFIALWHEISIKWLAWGTFTAALFSVETLLVALAAPLMDSKPFKGIQRALIAAVSPLSIAALMFSNMAIMMGFQGTLSFTRAMYLDNHLFLAAEAGDPAEPDDSDPSSSLTATPSTAHGVLFTVLVTWTYYACSAYLMQRWRESEERDTTSRKTTST